MPSQTAVVQGATPPVVHIPHEVLYSGDDGHQAYWDALEASEGVIIVPRQGRMEYIIDHKYAHEVLTDGKNFIFDKGVVKMLHMEFMLWFKKGTFVTELDGLVQSTVQTRLGPVVAKLAPLLEESFVNQFWAGSNEKDWYDVPNVFDRCQMIIAHAMAMLICGPEHVGAPMVARFMAITTATARLVGFCEQIDRWPAWARFFYPYWANISAMFVIIPTLLFGIAPELWSKRHTHIRNAQKVKYTEFTSVFPYLLAHHWSEDQSLFESLGNFLWVSVATLGIVFASIHQTVVVAVWVLVELARRQESYLKVIREEWDAHVTRDAYGRPNLHIEDLNRLQHLDSFIREVMRCKGDAFAPVRLTTKPTRIGGYVVPANSICLPSVRRAHTHPDNHGSNAHLFDGFRWVDTGRPAVQGNEGFISFGLGRWACPGRHLAVAEIKILVYLLFSQFDVKLDEETFEVLDPLNTTSVAPKATLKIRKR